MIDVLILKKQTVYQNEEKMRILKEQDDKAWNEMQKQYNSSDDSEEQRDEDYSWLDVEDNDTYFTLCTKFKNNYEKDQ